MSCPHSLRLAVVLSHPTQYYSPWFRWLAAHTTLTLRVFYLWQFGVRPTLDRQFQTTFQWDVDLLQGYAHEFVPNVAREPGTHRFNGLVNPTVTNRLSRWQPDAILLFGYKSPSQLAVIAWARLRNIPLLFRGDSHFLGRGRPTPRTRLTLGLLYSQFSAFACVGSANRDYFRSLGVPEQRIYLSPHAVDDALFNPDLPPTRRAAVDLRLRLDLSPAIRIVLFAGKLVPAKQPLPLMRAFVSLDLPGTALVFVGDGPERAALQAEAADARPGAVHFLPFANQSEMPSRYLMADIFCLPSKGSYETWGLAINEAMHLGVPCLVSDRVGCQRDLVTDGSTGWVFQASDPNHLRARLAAALTADLAPIREAVRQRIARYTYREAAAGLLRALQSVRPAYPTV